jgi:hypothetical protein
VYGIEARMKTGWEDYYGVGRSCGTLRCTVLHCTVLYCTVLYCAALHCTVLYYTGACTRAGEAVRRESLRWELVCWSVCWDSSSCSHLTTTNQIKMPHVDARRRDC